MKSCLVIEDDYLFYLEAEIVLKRLGYSIIQNARNLKELNSYFGSRTFDIIISDMILENGELAWKFFRENEINTPVIFTTVLEDRELFHEIQKHRKYLYLVKPISQLTLESAIVAVEKANNENKALPDMKGLDIQEAEDHIYVRTKGQIFKVLPKDILFVNSDGNYCKIQTSNKKYIVRSSIKNVTKLINKSYFMRVQRAYLINTQKIDKLIINQNEIMIEDYNIPIGRKYKKDLIDFLKNN